jgi:glycosyltransferase involved in cell wall biosynthesis
MHLVDEPFVSVVIPARNEERRIGACVAALLDQTYASDRMEIVIAEGGSDDRTREIVSALVNEHQGVRLVDNPTGRTPTALNAAILASRGSVICRMDAHSVALPDYVERCVAVLKSSGAWAVGGRMDKVGDSPLAGAIAAAATSRFGIGDSAFHYATVPTETESVYLGCWPKEVFHRIGLFNPALVRNQDDELSMRIHEAGGVVWFDPTIVVRYHGRESLTSLFRQYRGYGRWKVPVLRLHPGAMRWRHAIPPMFVSSLGFGLLITPAAPPLGALFAVLPLAAYVAGSFFVAARIRAADLRLHEVMEAFAAMHLGYGIGVLEGLVRLLLGDRVPRSVPRLPAAAG